LMRLSPNVIEAMVRHLGEKGLSWNDYLSVSASFYGGRAASSGRWAVPSQ